MPVRKDGGSRADEVGPAPIDGWIGSRIRFLRNQQGYRAVDLAERIGITRQQLEKYEKGETRIHASRLWDIAVMMEVSPGWFFQDFKAMAAPTAMPDFDMTSMSAQGVRLVAQFEKLSPEQRRAMMLIANAFEAEAAAERDAA